MSGVATKGVSLALQGGGALDSTVDLKSEYLAAPAAHEPHAPAS